MNDGKEHDAEGLMDSEWFPILWGYQIKDEIREMRKVGPFAVVAVPWRMLAPFERNASRNHGQTLQRLAERGGLGVNEALSVLDGRRYSDGYLPIGRANAELARRVQDFLAVEAAK